MTRYARAQGSKADNKREEEAATPWHVMVANIRRSGPPTDRRKDLSVKSRPENPEDFDESDDIVNQPDSEDEQEAKKKVKEEDDEPEEEEYDPIRELSKHKPDVKLEAAPEIPESTGKKKKPRKQNKCLNCKQPGHLKKDCPDLPSERRKELQELLVMKQERKGQGTGRKKNKRSASEAFDTTEGGDGESSAKKKPLPMPEFKHKKVLKDKTGQIVAEGEALFQGFRVKAEDAKRLKDLHRTLQKNKVSQDEIKEVLKRERRRAEKALSNSKRNVCYNCRESGHVLADCPGTEGNELPGQKVESGKGGASKHELLAGVCFKCGSAEHTSKDCRSKKKGEQAYSFATCFICRQTGHLAKSCPDNPRGLYPKGGGCGFCGSVEHLKNDCARKIEKDAKTEIRVGRSSFGMSIEDEPEIWTAPETIEKKKKSSKDGESKSVKKKIIKF